MAGDLALCRHSGERWSERTTGGLSIWTTRVEGTAAGNVKPVRDFTNNVESPGWRAPWGRGRSDQSGGVWVPGLTADGFSAANLDEFAQVHDTNPITHMLDSSQVVADQEIGDPEFSLQIFQEIENLRTDGDIERGHRLVEDYQGWLQRQSPRDADTLTLTTAKLMWEALGTVCREPYGAEHLLQALLAGMPGIAMNGHRFGDDITKAHAWIQRTIRILKDSGHGFTIRTHSE